MSYQHAIAVCRNLLLEGNLEAVHMVAGPLISRGDGSLSEDATLRATFCGATLLGGGDSASVIPMLARFEEVDNQGGLDDRAWADVASWLGWALAIDANSSDENLGALSLLCEAERVARCEGLPTTRLWASLGYGRLLLRRGHRAIARKVLAEAMQLAAALKCTLATRLIEDLDDSLPQFFVPSRAAGQLTSISDSFRRAVSVMESAMEGDLPILITGDAGVGASALGQHVALSSGRRVCVIECTSYRPQLADEALQAFRDADRGSAVILLCDVDRLSEVMLRNLLERISTEIGVPHPGLPAISTVSWKPGDSQAERGSVTARLRALGAVRIDLPPLRERIDDIELLARAELRGNSLRDVSAGITDDALTTLRQYNWPGNDAELNTMMSTLRRSLAVDPSPIVHTRHLPFSVRSAASVTGVLRSWVEEQFAARKYDLDAVLAATEKALIETTLKKTFGQVTAAAELLGLSRQGLYKKMKRLEVDSAIFHELEHVVPQPNMISVP